MNDAGFDFGDIPIPPVAADVPRIRDAFDYPVGFNMAFIGVGQAGGRIAESYSTRGYGRVCAVNTTIQDLGDLSLPPTVKLDIGAARGAGKDPAAAAALAESKADDIFDLLKRAWGNDVDYAFVCLGAAGGTGSGATPKVVEIARRYMQEIKKAPKVGVIVALPKDAEGQRYAKNALATLLQIKRLAPSPIIMIDNEKIKTLFDPAISQEHNISNASTAALLHAINRLAGSTSAHTSFDRAEFAAILDSGLVVMGSHVLNKWDEPTDITGPIRDQLRRNLLADADLSGGSVAVLAYVLNGTGSTARSGVLDYGTEALTRMMAPGSTVFRGVYTGQASPNNIYVLVMLGGLTWPRDRLLSLAHHAGGSAVDELANILGV